MALTIAGRNLALGPISATTMSLHTGAAGGDGGDNEAANGGYARRPCEFGAAASGSRALTANVLFSANTGVYTHFGLWIGSTCVDTGALGSSKELTESGEIKISSGSITLN